MKPIETPNTNTVFVAPGCGDLPATKCHDPETGMSYVETCWELTPAEVRRISETGLIFVTVMGNGIQPLALHTESLVKDEF